MSTRGEAARLPGAGMHRMQILADFEPPKFRSEGRPAREGASPKGARPCSQRAMEVVRNPHLSLRQKLHRSTCAGVLGSLGRGYALCGRTSGLRSSKKFVALALSLRLLGLSSRYSE